MNHSGFLLATCIAFLEDCGHKVEISTDGDNWIWTVAWAMMVFGNHELASQEDLFGDLDMLSLAAFRR